MEWLRSQQRLLAVFEFDQLVEITIECIDHARGCAGRSAHVEQNVGAHRRSQYNAVI